MQRRKNQAIGWARRIFVGVVSTSTIAAWLLALGMVFGLTAIAANGQNSQPQQAPDSGPRQPPASVARVSSIEGAAQVFFSGESGPEQAVMNMPLMSGARLETGADGQAEVEFNDGSVARLTPNSSLQLKVMSAPSVELQQLSGLGYYELNVGPGHPPYHVEFDDDEVTPTENAIFRLDVDALPEVAVFTGTAHVEGAQIAPTDIGENQSLRFSSANGGEPYTIAQGIESNSWDQWNSDRDQAIAQEAAQQTPVRSQAGDASDENWNDLDDYGNWYPVPDYGNVWVPSGVGAGWDPFGLGYWGDYPGLGVTWISGYPWGWLPYHCGSWNYFSFGWGWAPGGCGGGWMPVAGVRGYPGYFPPRRPVFGLRGPRRLIPVNRGPAAVGPWGSGRSVAAADHQARLNLGAQTITPVARARFSSQGFAGTRGISPGERTMLGGASRLPYQHAGSAAPAGPGDSGNRFPATARPGDSGTRLPPRARGEAGSRPVYSQRSPQAPHYSAPRSAPPRYSAPARGGGSSRR